MRTVVRLNPDGVYEAAVTDSMKKVYAFSNDTDLDAMKRAQELANEFNQLPVAQKKGKNYWAECVTCAGEGEIEGDIHCTKPVSECCGGCVTMISCPECINGKRRMEADEIQPHCVIDWKLEEF